MKLSEICAIRTGFTARSSLREDADGVLAIQWRDFAGRRQVAVDQLTRVDPDLLAERFMVAEGDVVFCSRGERNIAAALDKSFVEPALVVSPLMVLRPDKRKVLPEYIAWAINQPDAQRYFDLNARGSSIRMIPKSSLEDLEVSLPDLETQRFIALADALSQREEVLSQLLAQKKRELTSMILNDRAKAAFKQKTPERKKS